eukprot:GHVR01051449.1.p1 GENE.GHVR01051449.1~~GHVR01051449.1.p1  ORF type:complete len:332 (+),score=28.96 GHVR01051449.1:399-1394(+)
MNNEDQMYYVQKKKFKDERKNIASYKCNHEHFEVIIHFRQSRRNRNTCKIGNKGIYQSGSQVSKAKKHMFYKTVFKYSINSKHETELLIEKKPTTPYELSFHRGNKDIVKIDVDEHWTNFRYTFDNENWVSVTGFDMFYKKTILSKLTLRSLLLKESKEGNTTDQEGITMGENCIDIIVEAVDTGMHPLTNHYKECITKLYTWRGYKYNLVFQGNTYEYSEALFEDGSYNELMSQFDKHTLDASHTNTFIYMPDFWRIRVAYHEVPGYLTIFGSNVLEDYLIDSNESDTGTIHNYLYFYSPYRPLKHFPYIGYHHKFALMISHKKTNLNHK